MRVLAYTLSDRVEEMGDAPTFAELGYEHLDGYISFKGMFINPNCPQEVLDWYKEVTAQVCQSQEWKDFIAAQGQIDTFMASDEFNTFYDDYVANAAELFAAAA